MGRIFRIVALVASGLLTACQPASKPQPRMSVFTPAEYEPYARQGTGRVEGQAFMVQRNGGVVKGAGREVVLAPVTSYSTEWYQRLIVSYKNLDEADARAKAYSRKTIANGDGDFSFDGLPAGEYYLACWINWEVPQGYITAREGGIAHAKVKVEDGKVTRAIVTRY